MTALISRSLFSPQNQPTVSLSVFEERENKIHDFILNFLDRSTSLFSKLYLIRSYCGFLIFEGKPVKAWLNMKQFCLISNLKQNHSEELEKGLVQGLKIHLTKSTLTIQDLAAISLITSFSEASSVLQTVSLSGFTKEQLKTLAFWAKAYFSKDLLCVFKIKEAQELAKKAVEQASPSSQMISATDQNENNNNAGKNVCLQCKGGKVFEEAIELIEQSENPNELNSLLAKKFLAQGYIEEAYDLILTLKEPFLTPTLLILLDRQPEKEKELIKKTTFWSFLGEYELVKKAKEAIEKRAFSKVFNFCYSCKSETFKKEILKHLFTFFIKCEAKDEKKMLRELYKACQNENAFLTLVLDEFSLHGYKYPEKALLILSLLSNLIPRDLKNRFMREFFHSFIENSHEEDSLEYIGKFSSLGCDTRSIFKKLLLGIVRKGSLSRALEALTTYVPLDQRVHFYLSFLPFFKQSVPQNFLKSKIIETGSFKKLTGILKDHFQEDSALKAFEIAFTDKASSSSQELNDLFSNVVHYLIASGSFEKANIVFKEAMAFRISAETWEQYASTFVSYLEVNMLRSSQNISNDNNQT